MERILEIKALEVVREALKGIDKDECDSSHGWWQSSSDVKMGTEALRTVTDVIIGLEQQLQKYKDLLDGEVVAEFEGLPCKNNETIISTSVDYDEDILSVHEDVNNFIWLVANERNIINPIQRYKVLVIKQGD